MNKLKQHFQRRFLLGGLPADLKLSDSHIQITEYLPKSDEFVIRRVRDGRLRSVNTCLEFTTASEKSGMTLLNTIVKETDNASSESLIGVRDAIELRFNRYQSEASGMTMFVDVFLGSVNRGIITATVVAETAEKIRDIVIENSVELEPFYNYRLVLEKRAGIQGDKR